MKKGLKMENSYNKNNKIDITLIKERDAALKRVKELEARIEYLESQLSKVSGQLLDTSETLSREAEKSRALTHNARGAGRKKDPMLEFKKNRLYMMYRNGVSREEICKRMGISKATYYRFRKESCEKYGTGEDL